jgi:hypothetical protein
MSAQTHNKKSNASARNARRRRSPPPLKKTPVIKDPVERDPIEAVGKNYVVVDFPQEGEILTSPSYTLRVSTSAVENVHISIDGRDFQPMRESVGFWWYDWANFGAGAHTLGRAHSSGQALPEVQSPLLHGHHLTRPQRRAAKSRPRSHPPGQGGARVSSQMRTGSPPDEAATRFCIGTR